MADSKSPRRVLVAGLDRRFGSTLRRALLPARFEILELERFDELEAEVTRDPTRPPVVIVPFARAVREVDTVVQWAQRISTVFVLIPLARRRDAYRLLPPALMRFVFTPLVEGQLKSEIERSAPPAAIALQDLAVSHPTRLEASLTPLLARARGKSGVSEPPRVLDAVFVQTIAAILEALDCRRASILLLDDAHGDLIVNGSVLSRGRRIRSHVKLARRGAVTRRILEGRQPILVRDVSRELGVPIGGGDYESTSFVAVPVFLADGVTLVLNAADPVGAPSFESRHLEVLSEVGLRLTRLLASAGDLLPFLRHAARAQVDTLARHAPRTAIDGLHDELRLTRADLARRSLEFEAVREVSHALKGTFVLEELSRIVIQVVTRVLEAQRASLLLIDDERGDLLLRGAVGFLEDTTENIRLVERGRVTRHILKIGQPLLSQDMESEFDMPRRADLGYRTSAFMAAPVKIEGVTRAIINVSERRTGGSFTERDLSLLALLANQVAVALENFFLSQAVVERERLEKELQIAQRIQAKVLPAEFLVNGRVRVAASSASAKEVGGDYYDCFSLDESSLGIAIGDVSGKGMPAALVMMMLRSLLRVQAQYLRSPDRLIESLCRLLADDLETDMFITLFVGQLDVASGRLEYANAGHCPPYVLRTNPPSLEPLGMPDGEPIGLFGPVICSATTTRLGLGDKLVCFTDGVVEAVRARGDLFGTERLEGLLLRHAASQPAQLIEAVRAEVQAFLGDQPLSDDMSLVVVELLPDPPRG